VRRWDRPAIVWVHGGGFSGGDKTSDEIVFEATETAKQGDVSASIGYRLYGPGCSLPAATRPGDAGGPMLSHRPASLVQLSAVVTRW
jgi:acetyl esterase/lipase